MPFGILIVRRPPASGSATPAKRLRRDIERAKHSIDTATAHYGVNGPANNQDLHARRPIHNITQVKSDEICKSGRVASGYLPETGYSGPCPMAFQDPLVITSIWKWALLEIAYIERPRPDEAHIAQ